jgi:hypothetical protein
LPEFAPKNGVPYSQGDAAIVCPALLEIIQACGGACDKDDVVAAARNRSSPLHKYVFDKSQKEAAEAHYREQAAKLLRSFEVTWVCNGEEQRADLVYYVVTRQPDEDDEDDEDTAETEEVGGRRRNRNRRRSYVTAATVLEDPAYQQQVLAKMQEELAGYRRRYKEFAQVVDSRTRFGRVFRSICRLFEEVEAAA